MAPRCFLETVHWLARENEFTYLVVQVQRLGDRLAPLVAGAAALTAADAPATEETKEA